MLGAEVRKERVRSWLGKTIIRSGGALLCICFI